MEADFLATVLDQGLGVAAFAALIILVFQVGNRLVTSVDRLTGRLEEYLKTQAKHDEKLDAILAAQRETTASLEVLVRFSRPQYQQE